MGFQFAGPVFRVKYLYPPSEGGLGSEGCGTLSGMWEPSKFTSIVAEALRLKARLDRLHLLSKLSELERATRAAGVENNEITLIRQMLLDQDPPKLWRRRVTGLLQVESSGDF